jgi:tripartite-type tricarboxylate transporter receptor subunit TctC
MLSIKMSSIMMHSTRRGLAVLALGLAGLLSASGPAATQAPTQGWPSNPIRIIVPFPPGGTTDQIARRVQPLLQSDLKVPVIIENRAGASGSIGTQAAIASAPDGTTFLLVFDTHAVNPSVLPNLPFDTLRDLVPIMLIGTSPMVITSHPATPYKSFADLVAAAKKSDGAINYGTVGAGSLAHLAMTRIANGLKVTMTHVPYRGGGPLLTDAIAGHIPVTIASIALLSPQISSGALRPLAVTSAARYPQFPDLPTVSELGLAIDAQSWWGLLAPAKTPPDIIARMNRALAKALEVETVRQSLSEQGVIYRLSAPEELGRFIEAEIPRWAQVVKDNRIVASE